MTDTTTDRNPYVGEGSDGARRSAAIDRSEADGLNPGSRRDEVLASAEEWDRQAERLEAAQTTTNRLEDLPDVDELIAGMDLSDVPEDLREPSRAYARLSLDLAMLTGNTVVADVILAAHRFDRLVDEIVDLRVATRRRIPDDPIEEEEYRRLLRLSIEGDALTNASIVLASLVDATRRQKSAVDDPTPENLAAAGFAPLVDQVDES